MPVNSQHRDYKVTLPQWQRCRDTYDGTDAVKARATQYLPLLEGMDSGGAAYFGYLARALFYPAVARTVQGLAGLTFAKPPTVLNVPEPIQADFNDITLTGISLGGFGLLSTIETLITGRVGTLIDMPEVQAAGARPYWVQYIAEQVINWRVTRINGQQVLTRVVLFEIVEKPGSDTFEPKTQHQYRVLELVPRSNSSDLMYTVTLHIQDEKDKDKFNAGTVRIPLRRGQPLTFIPFTFTNARSITPDVEHPPLIDLVDVNLSHFRTSADHEHGAHFTALPTPWISGHKLPEGQSQLAIGSGNAWVLDKDAQAGMLEFSGAGLKSLSDLKEEKRNLMTSLGARMLETPKNAAEAAQTVRLRHAGEASAMSVLADACSQSITQSMRYHLFWSGMEMPSAERVKVTLNPEIMEDLSADEIRMLVETWQKKGISKQTLYYNLQWGEWTRPGVTFEQEEEEIKKENPEPPQPPPIPIPPQLPTRPQLPPLA
jgi:hypothetical protein